MERKTAQPVTLAEAKARLRGTMVAADRYAWVWRSPQKSVLAAFILGFAVGTSHTAREALTSAVVALLRPSRPRSHP